ncbi:MAG: acetyltransferase [Cytophagales bacterium]|nr:acetyltransferase [Cytophagales bacterium]
MKAIIYGLGDFAEYAAYVISKDSKYDVEAFCIEEEFSPGLGKKFGGLPVTHFDKIEREFPPEVFKLFVAIGNNEVRERIFNISKNKGYSLLNYLSSRAHLWDDLKFGENVFISDDSAIHPFVTIGDNTIIIGSKIGHHSVIGNNTLLSGCSMAGNVEVGNNAFIGLNASIKQNTSIGNNCIIGMGCVIEKNTNDKEVFHCGKSTKKRVLTSDDFKSKSL